MGGRKAVRVQSWACALYEVGRLNPPKPLKNRARKEHVSEVSAVRALDLLRDGSLTASSS